MTPISRPVLASSLRPVTPKEAQDWKRYRSQAVVDPEAAESGRLMTAHGMANDPEGRKRLEEAFGVEYCRAMYPEAYKAEGIGLGWLDRFRRKLDW